MILDTYTYQSPEICQMYHQNTPHWGYNTHLCPLGKNWHPLYQAHTSQLVKLQINNANTLDKMDMYILLPGQPPQGPYKHLLQDNVPDYSIQIPHLNMLHCLGILHIAWPNHHQHWFCNNHLDYNGIHRYLKTYYTLSAFQHHHNRSMSFYFHIPNLRTPLLVLWFYRNQVHILPSWEYSIPLLLGSRKNCTIADYQPKCKKLFHISPLSCLK